MGRDIKPGDYVRFRCLPADLDPTPILVTRVLANGMLNLSGWGGQFQPWLFEGFDSPQKKRKRGKKDRHRWPVERIAYAMARQRCTNPKNKQWKDYGGRGIQFRFANFKEFFAALGPRPLPTLSLDRIDNDGHYEPGNVRWATRSEQALNQRRKKFCKYGHPLTKDNLGRSSGRKGVHWRCLTCHRERNRR